MPEPDYLLGGYLLAVPTELDERSDPPVSGPFVTLSVCLREDVPEPEFSSWWFDRDEAEAVRRTQAPEALLLAVGFAAADVPGLLADADPYEYGASYELLRHHRPMSSGEVLGFEIVNVDVGGIGHSWLCYDVAREVQEALGIEVGDLGLLRSYDEARTALRWSLARPPDDRPAPEDWAVAVLVDVG